MTEGNAGNRDGWKRRMHERSLRILAELGEERGLAEAITALHSHQTDHWKELRQNLKVFERVERRSVFVQGREVALQCNPSRLVNATAPVSPEAVKNRPCFLCPENMPAGQLCFPFGPDLAAVMNPFPIFTCHLVVLSMRHRPQSVWGALGPMLDFSSWSGFSTLYNGPVSGASAPDHFHFQAAPVGSMPVESEAKDMDRGLDGFFHRDGLPQRLYVLARERGRALERFERVCECLRELTGNSEPELNLALVPRENALPAVAVHPRAGHRPDCYYREGPGHMMVSPGACDMAGLVILPRREDFERLDGAKMEAIFREVCMHEQAFGELLEKLGSRPLHP